MQIGELARRTGLTVKTVRYYSDVGLVPEVERTASGYRSFDGAAVVRLEFVRTLRELGLDLATIRKVLESHMDLQVVAASHAEVLDAQIRLLRLQRAALRALARRQPTPKEVERMNRIALATADQRRQLVQEFLDSLFEGTEDDPKAVYFAERIRGAAPELPDNPTDQQIDAWLEFADLIRDTTFRDHLREMGKNTFSNMDAQANWMKLAATVVDKVEAANSAGIKPAAPEATPVVDELVAAFAADAGRTDNAEFRQELLHQVEYGSEPRAERYWQLLAIISGYEPIPTTTHLWAWFVDALRART